jgi:DNA repair protein RecN (Recombination protein N)
MLQTLHIQNFALIEDLHISFAEGVTIFTGETGAGKSILLDAIGMLAGKRASAEFVRQGANAFLVEGAFFFDEDPELVRLLMDNHIECDDSQLVISRQFQCNGRGSILINGTLVPTAVARQIGLRLLDIHGQFDSRLIFDPAYHIRILDNLNGELQQARQDYDGCYGQWKHARDEARAMSRDEQEKERLLSVLEFQIKEIEDAHLHDGEDDALTEKINRLSHAEKLKDSLRQMLYLANGSESQQGLSDGMERLGQELSRSSAYDEFFQALATRAETLSYELEDIRDAIEGYAESFQFDEGELDAMQARLAAIEKLKRKYGFSIEKIKETLDQAKREFDRLSQSESILAELTAKVGALEQELHQKAASLMALRRQADQVFRAAMAASLNHLGMPDARIGFALKDMTQINGTGADLVELYFSANKGEDLKPLAKIASGGEISRIALALKTCSRDAVPHKTVIFDEIDVGISGQTGLAVAEHIRKLRHESQVFCITHLPQTAAIADQHYLLYKTESGGRTTSQVRKLSEGEHVLEIARMFSGDHTSKASIEAAKQIIAKVHD